MAMKNSGSDFSFTSAPDHRFIPNEIFPQQPLEFNNQGIQRPQDQQIRLCHTALPVDATISELLADHYRFALPKLVLDGNNRFVVHFSVLSLILILLLISLSTEQLHGTIHSH